MGCGWEGLCLEMCMFGQISVWGGGGWCLQGVPVSTKNLVIIHFCCTHIFPRDCPSCVLHFVYITPINLCASKNKTVADPGFFPGGAPTPKVGVPTYFFGRKLHENERIWTPATARSTKTPLNPLCTSKNTHTPILKITYNIKIKKKNCFIAKRSF